MRFLEVVVALAIKEFEQRRSKLTIHERVTRCVTRCQVTRVSVAVSGDFCHETARKCTKS